MTQENNLKEGEAPERQGPHGNNEPVPIRECGTGLNDDRRLLSVTDDPKTSSRRAKYGEEDVRIKVGNVDNLDFNVNNVDTKINVTRQRLIEREDGFFNHSCSG